MGDGLVLSCSHARRAPSFVKPSFVSPSSAAKRVHVATPLKPSNQKQLGRRLLDSSVAGKRTKQPLQKGEEGPRRGPSSVVAPSRAARVFLLDVNPLCYDGSQPSLYCFAYWITLFLSRVVGQDPVVAVFDGEHGNEYRRQLLPSYKARRKRSSAGLSMFQRLSRIQNITSKGCATESIMDLFHKCNIPAVKVEDAEADDVIATLVEQFQHRGLHAVIASPDKDFKQLISEGVQMVMPMPELGRWSFYTLKHYLSQYNCDPTSDLSLRCILGDDVDGVPGLQHVSPGFGRKTAVKLIKKHGTLENLLRSAAIRTVGKPYAQHALIEHADYLRRNFLVLSLRRDINIHFDEEWLFKRDTSNDLPAISCFFKKLS
ncbi:unnamed protein product [Victoria cruziana]